MRSFERTDRLNEELRRILGELLEREVRDPRIGRVTLTGVEMTRDLSVARVFVALPEGQDVPATMKGLQGAAGFLRRRLAENWPLRNIPELRFCYDESVERGIRMEAL